MRDKEHVVVTKPLRYINDELVERSYDGWYPILQSSCYDERMGEVLVTMTLQRTKLRFPQDNESFDM